MTNTEKFSTPFGTDIYYVWPADKGYDVRYMPPVGRSVQVANCPSVADAMFIVEAYNDAKSANRS